MALPLRLRLLLAAALAAPGLVAAQDGGTAPRWEIGVLGFGLSQQAYPGSDEQLGRGLVLPYVIYRGNLLRADRDGAGLRALRTERFELDIGVAGAFGSRAGEVDARRGMDELGTLVEFGPRLRWKLGEAAGGRWRLDLPLRGVFDLSDGAAHRGMSFEPELTFERAAPGGWRYAVGLGAVAADRRLGDYLYGVPLRDALPDRPAYEGRSGLVAWRLSTSVSKALTPDWRLFGFVRLDSVAGAANDDSPLVRRENGATAGIGLAWTWKRSQAPAAD